MSTITRLLAVLLALVLLAALALFTAPARLWLERLQLPDGARLERVEGSVLRGSLVLAVPALGVDNPVFLDWRACDDGGWQRCWQARARELEGSGRVAISPNGRITLYDSTLDGHMALTGLFVVPVVGRWQAAVSELRFSAGACLPAEIERLDAEVSLHDGRVLGLPIEAHRALLYRRAGDVLDVTIAGENVSGTVTLANDGNYKADLLLRLPQQLQVLQGAAAGERYQLQQTGVTACL